MKNFMSTLVGIFRSLSIDYGVEIGIVLLVIYYDEYVVIVSDVAGEPTDYGFRAHLWRDVIVRSH